MSFLQFLKDKALNLTVKLLAFTAASVLLFFMGTPRYGIIFIIALLICCDIILLMIEFFRKAKFYNELSKTLDTLDKKFLISELINPGSFHESEFLYDMVKVVAKSMNDNIAKYRISSLEYREYIETWIHEVKTPIAASRLIIENNKNSITKSLGEELTKIDDFIEQALFYSKSNNVESDYIIKELSLEKVVKSALKNHSKAFIESKFNIQIDNLNEIVFTDEKWMDFILGQIFANSIRYKTESPKLVVTSKESENRVVLSITDNGIGINPSDINRVWNKGFTGENGRKYSKSTGIGLYLCKKLCDKMGCGISLSSIESKYTTVEISFPKNKMTNF